jgi:hypothetical protein
MGADATGLFMIMMAIGLSFVAARTKALRPFAAGVWFLMLAYWLANRPASFVAGSAADQIIVLLFIAFGLGFLFLPSWFKEDGNGGGRFKNPFKSEEDAEEERQSKVKLSRTQRINAYRERTKNGR